MILRSVQSAVVAAFDDLAGTMASAAPAPAPVPIALPEEARFMPFFATSGLRR
jgi:hypothetical protein